MSNYIWPNLLKKEDPRSYVKYFHYENYANFYGLQRIIGESNVVLRGRLYQRQQMCERGEYNYE